MTTPNVFSSMAVDLERRAGIACGACGCLHWDDAEEDGGKDCCVCCARCRGRFGALLARAFPDIIPGSCQVVTSDMLERCISRMLDEIDELERQAAERERSHGGAA